MTTTARHPAVTVEGLDVSVIVAVKPSRFAGAATLKRGFLLAEKGFILPSSIKELRE